MNGFSAPVRLVVLISGNGTNLQAILDCCADGRLPAQVAGVISNRREAYGLVRARRASVPALYHPWVPYRDAGRERREYDAHLAGLVDIFQPDWVVLAGWMRVLSSVFLDHFPGRVVNLHPALPGRFPGTEAIARAYAAWQGGEIDHTGVMVHLVPDEGVDCGPVVAQVDVPILPGDDLAALEGRIHAAEHELLPRALLQLIQGDRP